MTTDLANVELSEVLDSFDLSDIEDIVRSQIYTDPVNLMGDSTFDQFGPIYAEYQKIVDQNENPDILSEIQSRFVNICKVFLKAIEDRFSISLNEDWADNHLNDLPAVTNALYQFFVLHHSANVEEALYGYIVAHIHDLYQIFESNRSKKDSATLTFKKKYKLEYAVIMANIGDVCSYIFSNGFYYPDNFFSVMNQDYIPLALIREMYQKNLITGVGKEDDDGDEYEETFIERIEETFNTNYTYKGVICYNLTNKLRNHVESISETKDDQITLRESLRDQEEPTEPEE